MTRTNQCISEFFDDISRRAGDWSKRPTTPDCSGNPTQIGIQGSWIAIRILHKSCVESSVSAIWQHYSRRRFEIFDRF